MGRHAAAPTVRPWIIDRTYVEGDSHWRGVVFTVGVFGAAVAGLVAAVLMFVEALG